MPNEWVLTGLRKLCRVWPAATMTLSPEQTSTERRSEPRFPMLLPVFVRQCNGMELHASTYSRDVSSSGIFFYLDSEVREGAPLEFTLSLPPGDLLQASIRVNYSGKVIRVSALPQGIYGVAASMECFGYVGNA
jgi:hypothetical protein